MPPILIKLFGKILLMLDKDVILKLGAIFILLPFLLILLFFMPVVFLLSFPFAGSDEVNYYQVAAQIVNEEGERWNRTKGEFDDLWVDIDWKTLVALDAVLLEQRFEKSNKNRALNLAKKFKATVTESTDIYYSYSENSCDSSCHGTVIEYERFKTLDEILDELELSEAEKDLFYNYLDFDMELLLE